VAARAGSLGGDHVGGGRDLRLTTDELVAALADQLVALALDGTDGAVVPLEGVAVRISGSRCGQRTGRLESAGSLPLMPYGTV